MKRTIKIASLFCLLALLLVTISACVKKEAASALWSNATYTEDTTLGTGEKTMTVFVTAEDKTVTFTILSNKETVGEALKEYNLIDGEKGPYGLYVKEVNGITADYDVNQSFWAFTKNGESMMTGVDSVEFSDGDQYELVYTKQ